MSQYVCPTCGFVHGPEAASREGRFEELSEDWRCPVCNCPKNRFSPREEVKAAPGTGNEAVYVCLKCGFRYEAAKGDPEHGVAPGTAFKDLPEDWVCPKCKAPKARFAKEG